MRPPHHQVGEDADPEDGADKRDDKESSGRLENDLTFSKPKASEQNLSRTQIKTNRNPALGKFQLLWWLKWRVIDHLVADVRQREPQREHDGQQEQVCGLFPRHVGPPQGQRRALLFLLLFFCFFVFLFFLFFLALTRVAAFVFAAIFLGAVLPSSSFSSWFCCLQTEDCFSETRLGMQTISPLMIYCQLMAH